MVPQLFLKGNKEEPRCKFSRACVGLLKDAAVPYDTFDILGDEGVRKQVKLAGGLNT